MNRARRKAASQVLDQLEALAPMLADAMAALELIRDEEAEVRENLESAGLGETEQAQQIEQYADALDGAFDDLSSMVDLLESATESVSEVL